MYGIIVNADGCRFANLHNWAKEVMPPLLRQEKATLWFIFDESSKRKFVVSGSDWGDFDKVNDVILKNPKLMKQANTIEQLAKLAGLPPSGLAETIRRYNELVESGRRQGLRALWPRPIGVQQQCLAKNRHTALLCHAIVSANSQEHGWCGHRSPMPGFGQTTETNRGLIRGR